MSAKARPSGQTSLLCALAARLGLAVPSRVRGTFLDLLLGSALTRGGHVTDAILAAGQSRGWTTYFWFLEHGRWSWLAVAAALVDLLRASFTPAVWHVVIDDTVVERCSTHAPDVLRHHQHCAKANRPRFLLGQGWICLAAVVERGRLVGAVPLLLHLVRRRGHGGKLAVAQIMMRQLGHRLGHVRLLLDAWVMRRLGHAALGSCGAWVMRRRLILPVIGEGHCVIGQVRKDTALFEEPPRPTGRRGRPRRYGARLTPERVAALPVHRSAQILYRDLEVIRYRTCCAATRFLGGLLVRAVWVEFERPDRPGGCTQTRLLLCTDPTLTALEVIRSDAKRWSVESLFWSLKHQWGLKDAWQRHRQILLRWVTVLAAGFALNQILAFSDPARMPGLIEPAPWRRAAMPTAGLIRTGLERIIRAVGLPAVLDAITDKIAALGPAPPALRRQSAAAIP